MHVVAVLALDGVIAFDLSTPLEVFGRVRLADGRAPYEVQVCGPTREVQAGALSLGVPGGLEALAGAQTVIVPGLADPMQPVPAEVLAALRGAATRGARLASICVGGFTLAATGLLNGLRATTHWAAADAFARRYPEVELDPGVLFVDNGQLLTSAGAAAGLDLCLHLVRRDHGAAVAADTARVCVMPLQREGGQAQYIAHSPSTATGTSLEPLLCWLREHTPHPTSLAEMAARAGLSVRTLNRRFHEQLGTTPLRWLLCARIQRAQALLESSDTPIERVAEEVGFGSTTAFRDQFKRIVGTSPQAYRRTFRASREC